MTIKIDDLGRIYQTEEIFKNAEVGDVVWDYRMGYGTIVDVHNEEDKWYTEYIKQTSLAKMYKGSPIKVSFPCKSGGTMSYGLQGYDYHNNNLCLFWKPSSFPTETQHRPEKKYVIV